MGSRNSERRKCSKVAPYLYFVLQVLIVAELVYIAALFFNVNTPFIVITGTATLYCIFMCFNKTINILRRCKMSKKREYYELIGAMHQ